MSQMYDLCDDGQLSMQQSEVYTHIRQMRNDFQSDLKTS